MSRTQFREKITDSFVDIGKYLIDTSKLVLGVAVISQVFVRDAIDDYGLIAMGAGVALASLLMGIIFKNFIR
jgi:hypothetical protein